MQSETKICQNCKTQFTIKPDDFAFYEKISVPPPTWCPECRMVRRMTYRNERTLYKDTCTLCGASIISQYDPKVNFVVYCGDCYASDRWDRLAQGREYDFSKPFFTQFREFMQTVPRRNLYIDFAVNSPYTNQAVYLKNCYLVFGGHHYEDSSYSSNSIYLNDCVDVEFSKKCEQCYFSFHLRQCNHVFFSSYSEECSDSWFLNDCRNCTHCFGCAGLRNKSYCIFNRQYSKEEYEKKIESYDTGSYLKLASFVRQSSVHALKYPKKYAWVRNAMHSSGDDLDRVNDCIRCFSATESEHCRYSFFIPNGAKDSYDLDHVGMGTELALEMVSAFGNNRIAFGSRIYDSHDIFYGDDCYNCANLFGCIGLRKNEYCILNKQYRKEEYEALVPRIIKHMQDMPYRDSNGKIYAFGEYFPSELSPFAYNEAVVHEYFPLTKEQAVRQGYRWKDSEFKQHQVTIHPYDMPDHVRDVQDSLLDEVIGCAHEGTCNDQCTTAFKLITQELAFYRRMNLPLPRLCPNCRHHERLQQKNPLRLWHRKCQCAGARSVNQIYQNTSQHHQSHAVTDHCPNEFETSYAPDRPEIVYCEQCYQAEVV